MKAMILPKFVPASPLFPSLQLRRVPPAGWAVLTLALLLGSPVQAARPWPDTRFQIVPFVDQLPNSLSETQRWFAATKFAGTQKMLRSEIRALRAYNTNFLCLHYQLGVGCGTPLFIRGDDWVSDWPFVNAQTNWFLLNTTNARVHQTDWNWDVMDVRYTNSQPVTGFPAYWISNCLDRIVAAEDDGVFADSFTPDAYGFGLCNPSHPWLESVDLCRSNWVPNLEQFGRSIRQTLEAPTNGFLFLPNLGGLVTGWLDMDYGLGHGGMIEGFAFWGPGNYFDPSDWRLQMDRALALARSKKIVICQTYPGVGNATERLFATASYLLVKGSATYLNLLASDAVALEFYPEYTLDLGGARGAMPAGINALSNAAWGVYRRDYTNGIVLVNPGASPVNIPNLGGTYWRVVTSGGGAVSASGSYGGSVTAGAVTNLSLAPFSAAVLLTTNYYGMSTNLVPTQPTNFQAFHRSGQTFLTWTERADFSGESYRVYRHTAPITANNLAAATRLYEVWEDSATLYANRYWDDNTSSERARYFDRAVITNGGSQLPVGTGLLVWTPATNDFSGGTTGSVYYAVTTVKSDGVENRTNFTSANTLGPLAEGVAEPLPVEAPLGVTRGHLYLQFMDLRNWNLTFHAPRAGNGYLGLDSDLPSVQHALAYVYDYVVFEPDCGSGAQATMFSLHGWGGGTYGPVTGDPDPWGWCAYRIYPIDQSETWWFGFARTNDFRVNAEVPAGDTIANFTEQRILRMLRDLQRQPPGPPVDTNRAFVYGQSMGGSGTLALALRYPNVFAAAYASEPMTDYATSGDGGGLDWRSDVEPKWGARALNLPVQLDAPAGWADPLKRYNGTNVWVWQNHRFNLTNRIADEIVPLGVGHGTNDMVIEWPTQARPFYGVLNSARRCYGGVVNDGGHSWMGFWGLPPSLWPDNSLTPFRAFQVVRNETVPGLANASGNGPLPPVATSEYNLALEWSSSWDAWDGAPLDTTNVWQLSLHSLSTTQTVDVTPRRTQQFHPTPDALVRWRNIRVNDGGEIQSGTVTADAFGLMTVTNVTVSPSGNRLRLELETPPIITGAKPVGTDFRLTFATVSGKSYFVQRSSGMPPTWTNLSLSLPGTGGEILFTHVGALTNIAGFYRILQAP